MQLIGRSGAGIAGLWVLAGLLLSSSAHADPIYFSSTQPFGLDPGAVAPSGVADPSQQVLASNQDADGAMGLDLALTFTQSVLQVISRPTTPSFENPFVVDMEFDIENTSGRVLTDAVLSFTRACPSPTPECVGFDADAVGFEESVEALLYMSLGDPLLLPSLFLEELLPQERVVRTVRMYFADDMPTTSSGGFVIPPVGVAGFSAFTQVPEPAAIFLLALGLIALGPLRAKERV